MSHAERQRNAADELRPEASAVSRAEAPALSAAESSAPARLERGAPWRQFLARVVWAERVIAPVCAVLLLLHPTPLTWPATLVGLAPSLARLALDGRPWRRSPCDLQVGLLLLGGLIGFLVTLDAASAGIRLTGLFAMVILFGWIREATRTQVGAERAVWWKLGSLIVGAVAMTHIAQPFLRLDRVPPLGWLAQALEPWELYRLLVADPGALQRFRWYASGAGALAAVGLCFTVGLALIERRRWPLAVLGASCALFAALLLATDNRGSLVAAALTLGALVVWWRPKLLLVAALVVFGMLDAIALGMVQRGLNLRTVVERLEFWRNGLLLAVETPWTGVGLGTRSVELTYRAAFQPTYPPFSHTHSIYVQGLLEQGALGLIGLALLVVAVVRLGVRAGQCADRRQRAAGLAASAGSFALLTAGLTEIVALTTLGGALLAILLGLLAGAAGDAALREGSGVWPAPRWLRIPSQARLSRMAAFMVGAGVLVALLLMTGQLRWLLASPFLNLGTTQLYRGTLPTGASRADRAAALADADHWLKIANTIDRSDGTAWRNRALAAAAAGDREAARQLAETAVTLGRDRSAKSLFGVGRVYAAIEDWDRTIDLWEQAEAGPQLLRLGERLSAREDARTAESGARALLAAAGLGAPGRLAQASVVGAALRRGESLDAALRRLDPLLQREETVYQTRLQIARELVRAGELDRAAEALDAARQAGSDPQLPLIQGMLLLAGGRTDEADDAEFALRGATSGIRSAALPVPDGDDPRYWLVLAQARLDQHAEAVATAQAGLRELTDDQASLRAPYRLALGDSLLALGRPGEAIPVYEAGLRLAPNDARLRDGLARARQAAGR